MLQSNRTQRESRILRGFVCVRIKKRSVNHVFYEGLCAHLSGMLISVSFLKIALGQIQFSFENNHFLAWLGRGPGSPPGRQIHQEKFMEVFLSDKNML